MQVVANDGREIEFCQVAKLFISGNCSDRGPTSAEQCNEIHG